LHPTVSFSASVLPNFGQFGGLAVADGGSEEKKENSPTANNPPKNPSKTLAKTGETPSVLNEGSERTNGVAEGPGETPKIVSAGSAGTNEPPSALDGAAEKANGASSSADGTRFFRFTVSFFPRAGAEFAAGMADACFRTATGLEHLTGMVMWPHKLSIGASTKKTT
jgi:hypothetical protein